RAGRSARSPAARLVADRHPPDSHAEIRRIGKRCLVQVLARFTLEEVVDAPVHVFETAGHAQNLLAAVAGFGPHRAALACAMHDSVRHTTQRYDSAGLKRSGFR